MVTNMAAFHLFPQLPCELRLEIWRLAMRPAGRGVHRFSIIPQDAAVPAAPRIPSGRDHSWTEGNGSAYLWDAGLWTACREAREVMMWHFGVRRWDQARRRLLRGRTRWTAAALAEEFEDMPAMVAARHGGRDWHLMVRPHKDLFWIEPRDWATAAESPALLLDLPFASSRRGYGHLSHVAVEHDASWNVALPKDLGALLCESTPRGFVARAMAECATNKLYCFVWLVDRALVRADAADAASDGPAEAGEADESDKDDAASSCDLMTFYDCDDVYVDTDRSDLVADKHDSDAEYEKTALHFIQRLGTIGNADYSLMGTEDGTVEDFDFQVADYLGVLACA